MVKSNNTCYSPKRKDYWQGKKYKGNLVYRSTNGEFKYW